MALGRFATVVNCIDGRAQQPVAEWIRARHGAEYVDTITYPGPEKALTQGPSPVVEVLRENVGVSVSAHESRLVAVTAHHQCAGNPVSDDEHKAQVLAACKVVAGWGFPVRVIGLWVNEHWQVEVIADSGADVDAAC